MIVLEVTSHSIENPKKFFEVFFSSLTLDEFETKIRNIKISTKEIADGITSLEENFNLKFITMLLNYHGGISVFRESSFSVSNS